jgi:hypothetical protein
MTTLRFKRPKLTPRRLLFGSLAAGAVAGALWIGRLATTSEAGPQAGAPPAATAEAPKPPPAASTGDAEYTKRAVAFVYGSTTITREQLGEYLIARFGPEKVMNLVNKLIIERKCQESGVTVADAEVDLALADEIEGMKVNRREFVEKVLRERHKSLYEWREDVLRPKLLVTQLLRHQVHATDDEVHRAFESVYGEHVYCQAIMWPLDREQKLKDMYETLLKDPTEFEHVARSDNSKALLAVGGMLEPVSPHSLNDQEVERIVFDLKEGNLTPVLRVKMGREDYAAVLKVLKKRPPDPTKKVEDMRPALEKEIIEAKVGQQILEAMKAMHAGADPKIVLKTDLPDDDWDKSLPRGAAPSSDGVPRHQQPVAYIYGTTAITREQFGEYLIERYGAERLGLMVNKIIIEKECAERGITVGEAEIQAALASDIRASGASDKDDFIKNYLRANRTTLYGYREDVLRPKLLLARLARGSVKVEEDDLRRASEAYHGERARCQIIMWPHTPRDHEFAIKQYDQFRKIPGEFDRTARTQASPRLAAQAGRIEPFARHTTGDEDFEAEVFRLSPGEMTPVVETREGYVIARLIERLPASQPPDDPEAAAAERARWAEEILKRKAEMQIPAEFAKLREAAAPNLILRPMLREEDWMREVKQEITGVPSGPGQPARN